MKKTILSVFLILLTILPLASCSNTPYDVIIRNTDNAATEQISQQETVAAMPPTNSPEPTLTSALSDMTVTPIILPTTLRYASTATPTVSGSSSSTSSTTTADAATLISFSPASNTTVLPNQVFYLTINLKNTGTTTWSTSYDLVFYSGTQLAYSKSYPLTSAVAVSGTYTASLYMIAPSATGTYTSSWYLADAYGNPFFYFSYVLVVGDYTSLTSVATYTPTITTTPAVTTTAHSYFDYMCSSAELSLQQGQGCEEFCKVTSPYKLNCYYNGTLNPTATTVPTSTSTAVPTAVPTSTSVPTTAVPTAVPTTVPTTIPTTIPTSVPTAIPTEVPVPTEVPAATSAEGSAAETPSEG